jgi:hypothetical protein
LFEIVITGGFDLPNMKKPIRQIITADIEMVRSFFILPNRIYS